jgi:hypothetical protein
MGFTDVEKTLSDFLKEEKLAETEGQGAVQKLDKWWNTYILKGKTQIGFLHLQI